MTPSEEDAVWIGAGLLRARILRFGATLQDLRLDPFANPLVLSLPDAAYRGSARALYAGAVVGRVAGRIANGRTAIEGAPLQLPVNAAPHHLHGGPDGFSHQDWRITALCAESVTLSLTSPAGAGGYPGTLEVTARYEVRAPSTLTLTLEAHSDAQTLVNLCHHPYFNLRGTGRIDQHALESPAQSYLPSDADALPTGEIAPVAGTAFDFTKPRLLGDAAFDNSLCLHDAPCGPLAFAGRLSAGAGAPRMEIWTTQPALHIYDGRSIAAGAGPRSGVALEAQGWPDAPNNAAFPSAILEPDTPYRQVVEYRFFN
ncbi:aldose epimerase family protein [Sulfitobacter sp. HNIBRBA2951]|uniref:aldose epimerase family protein n=1 Tax=Sulfitobacter aquimarinus TaxID=3158557 RepID=UPI0032DEAD4C